MALSILAVGDRTMGPAGARGAELRDTGSSSLVPPLRWPAAGEENRR
jgi:hypothetical protein